MGKATVASYDRTVEAHIVLRRQSFTHWYGPGIDTGPEDVDIDHLGFEPPFFGLHIDALQDRPLSINLDLGSYRTRPHLRERGGTGVYALLF